MNVWNNRWTSYCDIINKQWCDIWDTPRHPDKKTGYHVRIFSFSLLVWQLLRHVPWRSFCRYDWQFLDPPPRRRARTWTMIGRSKTCSVASLTKQVRQKLMSLWLPVVMGIPAHFFFLVSHIIWLSSPIRVFPSSNVSQNSYAIFWPGLVHLKMKQLLNQINVKLPRHYNLTEMTHESQINK